MYGVISKKSTFLWSWIYIKIIITGFIAVAVLLGVLSFIAQATRRSDDLALRLVSVGIIASGIAILVVHVLLIIVVYSFACELRKDKDKQTSHCNIVTFSV